MALYILDSDHLSLFQRGYQPLGRHISATPPERIAITIITVEELLRGRLAQVRHAANPQARLNAYHWLWETVDFLKNFTILKYSPQAEAYVERFRSQKLRVGTQDLRIAAIALSQEAVLITRNRQDFEVIPGLKLEDWSPPVDSPTEK